MRFFLFFCFLFFHSIGSAPIIKDTETFDSLPGNSSTCTEDKLEKIGDCVKGLVTTVKSMSKWVDQEYKFNNDEKKQFRESCEDTQKCFSTVKTSCPDFPNEVTQELDIMCSRFTFIIDKFSDCVPQLDKLTEIDCVNQLFGPQSVRRSMEENCENLVTHRKCARKEVEQVCGLKMADVLDQNIDDELKLYKCNTEVISI